MLLDLELGWVGHKEDIARRKGGPTSKSIEIVRIMREG